MDFRIPRTLPYDGHVINFTGPGRPPGSLCYLDATKGKTLELYVVLVERTGPSFSLGRVANNQAIPRVRIDHSVVHGTGSVNVGDMLVAGPLHYLPEGPRATAAWRVQAGVNGSATVHDVPSVGRRFGVITRVAPEGGYGWITDERMGQTLFVHRTQLKRGAVLEVGLRVSYVPATNSRGPAAFDVCPA